MKKLLPIILFLPFFSFAQTEWEYIGRGKDKSEFYMKDYRKKQYSDQVEAWVKIIEPVKIVKTKKGTVKKSEIVSLQKFKFRCVEKTVALISYADYRNGILIRSGDGSESEETIFPDSVGESLLNYVCSKF